MVVAHAGVAFLAVLITPVGIVVVVADQVVDLLRRSLLRAALGRSAEDRECQPVAFVEAFLHRSVVAEAVVVDAVDPVVAALSRRYGEGIRPAVVLIARGIGDHCTETVHRIAVHEAGTQPLAHLRRAGDDVGRTADAAQPDVRGHDTRRHLLVTCGVVQAAPQRPGRIAREGVVEPDAVHVDVLVLRIVTADVEAHLTELVGRDVVEDVLGGRERRRQCLRIVDGLHVELREHGVVDDILHIGGHHHRIEVLDHLVDTDRQVEVLELGGFEFQLVFPFGQLVDIEITVVVGHDGDAERFDDHLDIAQCDTAVTRDDLAFDAPVLGIRPGTGQREQDNK